MVARSGFRARLRRVVRWPLRWWTRVLYLCTLCALAPVPAVLALNVVHPPVTMVMLQQTAGRLASGERPWWPRHSPMPRDKISPLLRRAVLASEDDRFYLHHGIDFEEIDKALERRKRGGRLRGASTLSQQVAKNVFLWNGRSYLRKGLELYVTVWLELLVPKERILDLYLNLAEWAPGVYGAEEAARVHFGKSARTLGRDESARLAAILPSPRRWSPKGSIAVRRAAPILDRMRYPAPHPADLARASSSR